MYPAAHRTSCKKTVIAKPVRTLASHPLLCLRRVTFCHQRQKVTKERLQNPWFWNPSAPGMRPAWTLTCPAYQPLDPMPCFRIDSAPPSAGRSRGPALPWHIRGAPCVYRADEDPAAPLATYPVGADAHIGPPSTALHTALSLRSQCAHWLRNPRPPRTPRSSPAIIFLSTLHEKG